VLSFPPLSWHCHPPFSETAATVRSIHPPLHTPTICEKLLPLSSVLPVFCLTSIHCWQHVLFLALLNSFSFRSAVPFYMLMLLFSVVSGSMDRGYRSSLLHCICHRIFIHYVFISYGRFVSRTL